MTQIAILYQAQEPPLIDGVQKPMKEGGYSDSGADIAFGLQKNGLSLLTPTPHPDPHMDMEWVFPDTQKGIESAIESGAKIFWLNTVLFKDHPIESYFDTGIEMVGQIPESVGKYDDKYVTNQELKKLGIPIPTQTLLSQSDVESVHIDLAFPLVLKPIRGRGSQGVVVVHSHKELIRELRELLESKKYGDSAYVEEYLPGEEITITVMPPGTYQIEGQPKEFHTHWCLPAVKRGNHQQGIAPYSGKVAVMENSEVMASDELASEAIQQVYHYCRQAAKYVGAKAPIRIDGRADLKGTYHLFDLNMKPNMTGPSRSHRQGQDSLTALAARKIGWSYDDLLINMFHQKWKMPTTSSR